MKIPALVLISLLGISAARAETMAFSPEQIYPDGLAFEIRRDGKAVGRHSVTFRLIDGVTEVSARSDIEVPFLMFTGYRFSYVSISRWHGDDLRSIVAETDDDGERRRVRGWREGARFIIENSDSRQALELPVFPTDHWHPGVLEQPYVLNTITGRVNNVRLAEGGPEWRPTSDGGWISARRYDYSGDLNTTVWYDMTYRWVGMRFSGRDGSTIEYVCATCGRSFAPGETRQ